MLRELVTTMCVVALVIGIGVGIIYVQHGTSKACPHCGKVMFSHSIQGGVNHFCPDCNYTDMEPQVPR